MKYYSIQNQKFSPTEQGPSSSTFIFPCAKAELVSTAGDRPRNNHLISFDCSIYIISLPLDMHRTHRNKS